MRLISTLFSIALVLAASVALAEEKAPDTRELAAPTAKSLELPLSGSLSATSGAYDRIYTTGSVSLECSAETFDSVNDGSYYDLHCLQVDDYQPIELILDGDVIDTVMTLYCDPFDPLHPEQNVVAFDDDGGVGTLSAIAMDLNLHLQPGQEYWLVVSSYGASMTGDYTVFSSDNVFDCGTVAEVRTNWGTIKGMYR